MKKYLIREFTEFNLQRLNPDNMPMAMHVNNPELSQDAYDRHVDHIRQMNFRLNNLLNTIGSTNNVYNLKQDSPIDGLAISNLKILRTVNKDSVEIDLYISFMFNDKEYYGEIKDFVHNPRLESEVFTDPDLYLTKAWVIKIKGLIVKVIKQWMNIQRGKYTALKDIQSVDTETGNLIIIKEDTPIIVLRSLKDSIIAQYDNKKVEISGLNFYFFNYYFKKS